MGLFENKSLHNILITNYNIIEMGLTLKKSLITIIS